jgi:hypothetical protein
VELRNRLVIYLSRDKATVVCVGPQSDAGEFLDCFSVSATGPAERAWQMLATLIAQGCADRKLRFSEVVVALDCAMFMQHSVQSEFSDPRKIAATVRFDAEEALATDIGEMAIAFQIISSEPGGSKLTVFTVQRKVLSEILLALQSSSLDPVMVEPDIVCLSRFICHKVPPASAAQGPTLFGILARNRGYLIGLSENRQVTIMRTFLLGPAQDRTRLLTADVRITAAMITTGSTLTRLSIYDIAGSVRNDQINRDLGIEVEPIELADLVGCKPEVSAQCSNPVDFAIVYGSCLARHAKTQPVDFRSDFMPYQGKRARLRKSVKVLGICLAVLLLALGLYFQMQLLNVNKDRSDLRRKFAPEYSAVVLGEKKMPAMKEAVRRLGTLFRRIESEKKGIVTDQEAVAARLTLVLGAFNNCAKVTDLNVESISITPGSILVVGSTSGRANTLRLFEAIKNGGLEIIQQGILPKDNRDNFTVTVIPLKKVGSGNTS